MPPRGFSRIIASMAMAMVMAMAMAAPGLARATAAGTGKATTLHFSANTTGAPVSGRIPSAFGFSAPGYTFDPRAIATHCSHEAAVLNECPAKSAIGAGSLLVHVVSSKFARNTTIPINLYLQSSNSVIGVAFVGGPHVVTATLNTSKGVALTFNLPKVPAFPGVTLTLEQVGITLSANRVIVTHKRQAIRGKSKGKHKFKVVVRRTYYHLIHTPAQCTGSWSTAVTLGFPDGSSAKLTTPIACRRG
jgi:hypothetical protein